MTTTDNLDIAQLASAEDKFEQAVRQLERAETFAYNLAADCDDDDDPVVEHAVVLADLVDGLHAALDCLQMGLGRPYVWLLNRIA